MEITTWSFKEQRLLFEMKPVVLTNNILLFEKTAIVLSKNNLLFEITTIVLTKNILLFEITTIVLSKNNYSFKEKPTWHCSFKCSLVVHLNTTSEIRRRGYVNKKKRSGYSHIVYMRIIFYPHIVCSNLVTLDFKFKILFLKSKLLI